MIKKKYVYRGFAALTMLTTLAMAVPALAENGSTTDANATVNTSERGAVSGWGKGMMEHGGKGGNKGMMKFGVFGTVTAVSGNTITISGKQGPSANVATVTYTVDATNAKIVKDGAAGTISSILVGDTVMVQGKVNGTNIIAMMIRDGKLPMRGPGGDKGNENNQVPPITGNGQPIVAGTVSAVNGSTITITNKSNITYTVDATNAKIVKGPNPVTISDVAVGDMVVVQGTINGNAVVAASVFDQSKPAAPANVTTQGEDNQGGQGEVHGGGFFGGIGSFFSHLFGF